LNFVNKKRKRKRRRRRRRRRSNTAMNCLPPGT